MKIAKLILTVLLFTNIGYSQSIKVNEPEFGGIVVYVNDTIGSGIRLEQQTASIKTTANAATYIPFADVVAGKAKTKNVVKGNASKVVIFEKNKVKFIVSVKDNSVDPSTNINIFKLVSEKDTRTLELASATIVGGTQSGEIAYIPFSAKKYGKNSYIITIDKMEEGEYAITLSDRRDLFNMFAIKQIADNPERINK